MRNLPAAALLSVAGAGAENYGPTKPAQCAPGDASCSAGGGGSASPPKQRNFGDSHHAQRGDDAGGLRPGQCGLYLAPSSLPYAGLGLYAGAPVPHDLALYEFLGGTFPGYNDNKDPPLWTDLFVPIADPYKALPYRGQQRFPSWLRYVWPERPGALSTKMTKLEDEDTEFPPVPSDLWDYDMGLDRADGLEFYVDDLNDQLHAVLPDFQPSQRTSAFVPGLASLANHAGADLANVDRIYGNARADYAGQEAPWHAGAGAFTPHHKVDYYATRAVGAGTELVLDYGIQWDEANDFKLDAIVRSKKLAAKEARAGNSDAAKGFRERQGFVEGIDKKWDKLDLRERNEVPDELPTERAKRENVRGGMATDSSEHADGYMPYSEYRGNTDYPVFEKEKRVDISDWEEGYPSKDEDITRPMPWLDENGACLSSGKLRLGPSDIQYAGRGVFSTTHIGKGETILPSPLIAMRRDDFTIYKTDNKQETLKDIIDKTKVVGTELLFNYAFTHPDSPLYLVPTAPIANFINHGSPMTSEKPNSEGANVGVRWPKEGSALARMFQWTYNQKQKNHYDNDFENTKFDDPNPWLRDHPIDVMERSGKLALEYVALRDIHNGEEILIDYGDLWNDAWIEFVDQHPYARAGYFRHAIGVPQGFFPDNWLHVTDQYEIAEISDLENKPLEPGVVVPMTWAHNGKPVGSKYAYVVGLPKGFSDRFLEYSEGKGVIELYRKLLMDQDGYHLPSDGFNVYRPGTLLDGTSKADRGMEFFAHRFVSDKWNFNMHFVAAWDDTARRSILNALGEAGFDFAVRGVGERFGYDNITCFHASYMGVTHCDKAKMHSDIYATDDKSWNIVFPLVTVEGGQPELDIMSEDMNTVVGVHYLKDIAYAIGDFGYHMTRPIADYDPKEDTIDRGNMTANGVPIRVVFGAYCAQIDRTNIAMLRHIYDGDDPAPFSDQFTDLPMKEYHWDRATGKSSLSTPGGKGF